MSGNAEFVIKNGVLKQYKGPGGDVSVPEGVTEIGYRAFENCTGLTRVLLPESVTELDVRAFCDCTGLREVVFPKSMTKLGSYAFHGCTCLESVRLPEGVTEIIWGAFENCTALHTVYLPEGVTTIDREVFRNCTALTEIQLPDSVTEIDYDAFNGCTSLESVRLPEGLTRIGVDAFSGCSSLTSLVIPKGVLLRHNPFVYCPKLRDLRIAEGHAALTAQNGALYDKDQNTLICWPGAEGHVELPDTVVKIEDRAFVGATGLTGITLPGKLDWDARYDSQRLSGSAFVGCVNLTEFWVAHPILYAEGGALYRRDSEGGVALVSWPGASGEVEVPQGVKGIGKCAFSGCTGLTGIRLPDSVTELGSSVFSGCTGLVEAVLPEDIGALGSLFENCTSLKRVKLPTYLTWIGNGLFRGCSALEEVTFPQTVTHISFDSFEGCTSLRRIIVPESLKEVCNVPDLSDRKDYPRFQMEPDLLRTTSKLSTELTELSRFSNAEGFAHALLYQSAKAWQNAVRERITESPSLAVEVARVMTELLAAAKRPKKAEWERACAFVLERQKKIGGEALQAFYDLAREKKAPVLADLEKDSGVRKRLLKVGGDGAETAAQPPEHPVERMVWEQWKVTPVVKKLQKLVKQGVRYADSEEKCSKEAVIWLIAANSEVEIRYGSIGFLFGEYDDAQLTFNHGADQIAAGLNRTDLMALLDEKIFAPHLTKDIQLFIPAYCRYADEEQMQKLLKQQKTWHSWYEYGSTGRNAEECIQEHLYLSDTKAAMRSCNLELYAKVHGTDAQTLRDTVLADLGLDAEGKKRYDLGGKTVEARLGDDLTLTLYDEAAGKVVKSIPKKNADPEKYEAAKKEFARLKKDIRAAVKERVNLLFQRFLDGEGQKGADWQKVYFQNPMLNQIARLLVWSQGKQTFTMTAQGTVDSAGQPYEVGEEPVKVAHPMEMDRDDLEHWQKYFTSHALKQPFAQVWEPVIDFAKVKEDRYQGLELPANHLRSRDKHGIWFEYDNATSELRTSFDGLDLECDFTEFQRHWMDQDARVVFGKLKVEKPGRAANHVLSLLDKWTVEGRILKDDVTAVEVLDSFTLAQVTELVNLAIEHQCTNCTAALLAYKNAHFADFDPMDVFTLE